MALQVLHCADIHLGRRRLNGRLPDSDFAAAFEQIVSRARSWRADVVLIAGDLFDAPQIPPPVLRQATAVLQPLKKARIPVLAIEGNHDRAVLGQARPTWVRYLAEDGLLTLLTTPFTPEGPQLTRYDPQTLEGSYVEVGGVRFVGAGYLGAGTDRRAAALAEALPDDAVPTVMLLHAGPEYFVGEGGGFQKSTLEKLQARLVYLALGHIHKPMIHRDPEGRPWAVNPGSPENCRLDEAAVPGPRGWAEVLIDPEALPGLVLADARICDCPRRPVLARELDITPYGNKYKAGAEAIAQAALKLLAEDPPPPNSVVRLVLKGQLNIGRIAVEPLALGEQLASAAGLAGVEVSLEGVQLFTGRPGQAPSLAGLSTAQIEKLALEEILRAKPPDGLEEQLPQAAEFCARLKSLVARGAGADAVLDALETSVLPAAMVEARGKL
ncbi:MAG: metallophosphoesterase family protein [Planctomycetota bacterium]|nr:metallophosphoesterase family protein [Planctomycetota bacterium]